MPSQPPLPHLLIPYASVPSSSFTVLSSVLGATGNWLVLRFLYAALSASSGTEVEFGSHGVGARKSRKVVLGVDLARLAEKRQFAYIDGLSELFYAPTAAAAPIAVPSHLPGNAPSRTTLPLRSQLNPPASARPRLPVPAVSNATLNPTARKTGPAKRLRFSGSGIAALDSLEKDIISVINQLKEPSPGDDGDDSELLLIVDQPDLLLAATGLNKGVGATEMEEWVMGLQQSASATILTIASDSPLIHNASTSTHQTGSPLEVEHAAFAIGLAHRADMVMQLRSLETGAARDVSGVLRVSKGGAWGQREDVSGQENWEEKEVLYFVQRDGGVSVFGRGE